ncbi:MAG: PQQ-like beta-propeller repeat protein [Verrucomicrobiales bacterium]|nr:PQQ-like beta-propeller repeat protein [Verrucomicrobiales bacterium]
MNQVRPVIAASALLLAGLAPATAASWPNYRGPAHNGASTEKLPATSWPASGPHRVWKSPTASGFSSITVAENRAFTLISRDIDGVKRELLLAMDATTGRELWAQPLAPAKYDGGGDSGSDNNKGGDGPRSTPTVDGDLVFTLDARFQLAAFEAATGNQVWRRDLATDHSAPKLAWQNAASPVIDGNLIFVACGGEGQALLGIDKRSGTTVWKTQDDKMTHATPVVTTILGQRQVLFFTQTGLVAVKPQDGAVLWRQPFPYKVSTAASPIVAGDIVYCSAGYGVGAGAYRIAKEGSSFKSTELWRKPNALQNHWSTPVVHDGHLYGLFGFKEYGDCPLQCVELATGEIKWSQRGFGPGNVTWVDGHLLVLGDAGQLVLAEATPAAYKEKAKADVLDGKCWSTPTFTGGRVFARSTTESVCLDLNPRVAAR